MGYRGLGFRGYLGSQATGKQMVGCVQKLHFCKNFHPPKVVVWEEIAHVSPGKVKGFLEPEGVRSGEPS